MYSVVTIAGHQYKVAVGQLLDVQKLSLDQGASLEIKDVHLISQGDQVEIGVPTIEGAKVQATIIKHGKGNKKIVFKRKPGAYRKKNGHRQDYTALLITEIQGKTLKDKIASDHKYLAKINPSA